MYQPMLALHWKQVRFGLIPFVVAAFALPLLAVQGLGSSIAMMDADAYRRALTFNQGLLVFFPALAASIGCVLALSSWNWDHQQKHVYALSLPIARWRYAALKMGAGAVIALVPTIAFGIGCLAATASVELPAGLHAYPVQLTVRFFLATLMAYSILFALAAGTMRTTIGVFTAAFLLLLLSGPLNHFLVQMDPMREHVHVVEWVATRIVESPGPLQIFVGNWSLIDV